MTICRKPRFPRPSEQGYMLVALMLIVALLVMSMAVAVPKVREEIQRDQEVETMHRGQQYIRAIQLYYRKFRTFPPNVEALQDANGLRFLRRRYIDPITGKDDWQPILFGQNKAPTAFGFFGEPLGPGGIPPGGLGLSGGGANGGASPLGSGSGASSPDNGSSASSGGSDSPVNPNSTFFNSFPGQTFGGGGIIGFSPASPKESILIYKTKDHYIDWEFVYDPLADLAMRGVLMAPTPTGLPPNTGSPGFNPGLASPNPAPGASPSQSNSR